MRLLRALLAFLRRDLLIDLSYQANVFLGLASGLFALATFHFLARTIGTDAPSMARYRGDYFTFALIGISVMGLLRSALSQLAHRVREAQVSGTLEAILASPLSPASAIVLSSIYPLAGAALRGVGLLTIGSLAFGANLSSANIPAALASLLLGLVCFLALGIFAAAFTLRFKRGDPLTTAIDWLSALLSGIIFPVEVLPHELQRASLALPTTHALEALRGALVHGLSVSELARPLGILVVFAGVTVPVGLLFFWAAVRRAEEDGTLSHF
jgi:ABC-2 type transport system permease protein